MAVRKSLTQLDGCITDYDLQLSKLYAFNCNKVIDVMFTNHDEYSKFSYMAPRPFVFCGERFPDVETYFQWSKANLFRDSETAEAILKCGDPFEARRLGRKVKNFRESIWDTVALSRMEDAMTMSFDQNPEAAKVLKDLYGAKFTYVNGGVWAEDFPRILTRVQEKLIFSPGHLMKLRDVCFETFQGAYSAAKPTDEKIVGNYRREFCGEVKWSRALDFKVRNWPEFKGIRYIDFTDCTTIHILKKDGNSVPMESLSLRELRAVTKALRPKLAFTKRNDNGIKM